MRSAHSFSRAYNRFPIGFPPADATLRSWILSEKKNDQDAARKRLHGFVYALLTVTLATLETIWGEMQGETPETEADVIGRQEKLACAFRERMTKGQSFKGSNAYRDNFYKRVIESADEVSFRGSSPSR
jgi:hypothetical protein